MDASAVEQELRCTVCGYNLRGLPLDGACPECGANIANSKQGDFLRFANPDWVRCIYRGACLICAAFLGFFGYYIVGALVVVPIQMLFPDSDALIKIAPYVFFTIMFASTATLLIGVILFTTQEPREYLVETPTATRRIARAAIVVGALLFILRICAIPTYNPMLIVNLINITGVIGISMTLKHAKLLTDRIPDHRLSKALKLSHVMLLTVGLAFSGLLVLFWTVGALITKWSTVAGIASFLVLCAYVLFSIVALRLFVGVAAALKHMSPANQ